MSSTISLENLSNIRDAKSSQSTYELFKIIESAYLNNKDQISKMNLYSNVVQIDHLREDNVVEVSQAEQEIIRNNFPRKTNGYLIVPKVI